MHRSLLKELAVQEYSQYSFLLHMQLLAMLQTTNVTALKATRRGEGQRKEKGMYVCKAIFLKEH